MESTTQTVRLTIAIPETLLHQIHEKITGDTIEQKLLKCVFVGSAASRTCNICGHLLGNVSNIVCAKCGTAFHASCVSKLTDSCPNCGYKE